MPIDFTTTKLLANIRTRAMIPTSQNLFTTSVLVDMVTAELHADIVPLIMSVREEYFVHNCDVKIVSGTDEYEINQRAIGQKLRDACLLNSYGKEVFMPRIDLDDVKYRQDVWSGLNNATRGFYFRDGFVGLYPSAADLASYKLRMKIFRRPNNLCQVSAAGKVLIINTGTNEVTLDNLPATWAVTDTFDVIKGYPGFNSRQDDATIMALSSLTKIIKFTALPSNIAVGDWVALSGFSPIPQIQYEVFNILEQRVTIKVLEDMGDSKGLENASAVYDDMKEKFINLVTPRADGSPKRVVRKSPLWGGGGSRSRGPWW